MWSHSLTLFLTNKIIIAMTIKRNSQSIISLIIILFINTIFSIKYFSRYTEYAPHFIVGMTIFYLFLVFNKKINNIKTPLNYKFILKPSPRPRIILFQSGSKWHVLDTTKIGVSQGERRL